MKTLPNTLMGFYISEWVSVLSIFICKLTVLNVYSQLCDPAMCLDTNKRSIWSAL